MKIFHVHCQPDMLARIDTTSFPTPKIFDWLQQQGNIDTNEMYNILTWYYYTVIVDEKDASRFEDFSRTNVEAYQIGHIVKMSQLQLNCWGYNNG